MTERERDLERQLAAVTKERDEAHHAYPVDNQTMSC
jgi:hypothetical protein